MLCMGNRNRTYQLKRIYKFSKKGEIIKKKKKDRIIKGIDGPQNKKTGSTI